MTTNIPIIDTHNHYWKYYATEFAWVSDNMAVLRKDYLPAEHLLEMQKSGVVKSVAVQAAQSLAETTYLMDLAAVNPHIVGVVGWADIVAGDLEQQLSTHLHGGKLKGLRHIRQDELDPKFFQQKAFIKGIKELEKLNLRYDILIFQHQLPDAIALADAVPNQLFVLDHLGKPNIAEEEQYYDAWLKDFAELAKRQNVYCKLSGLVNEADWKRHSPITFTKYFDAAVEHFGPSRLMFGSDWPVSLVAASYDTVLGYVKTHIKHLSPSDQGQILAGTATHFYNL